MRARTPAEEPLEGAIEVVVEAAPQGILRYTLDPEGPDRVWSESLLAHDDTVIGSVTSPEQVADLLVRGSIACIARDIPSLTVGGAHDATRTRTAPERADRRGGFCLVQAL